MKNQIIERVGYRESDNGSWSITVNGKAKFAMSSWDAAVRAIEQMLKNGAVLDEYMRPEVKNIIKYREVAPPHRYCGDCGADCEVMSRTDTTWEYWCSDCDKFYTMDVLP